jgi:flavorubredoxin
MIGLLKNVTIAQVASGDAQTTACARHHTLLRENEALKHLLVVYHSKTGNTQQLADAIVAGATAEEVGNVEVRVLRASDAGPEDLLWADGLLLGTPENFGYLSGAVKDFLDRTFYEVEGKLTPLPYAMFVSAGNDGSGAVRAMERIANGYPFIPVQAPFIAKGIPSPEDLETCRALGLAMALGVEMGIF